MAIVVSVFPAILEAKKSSEVQYYARLQKLYDMVVLISLSIALPMSFMASSIVEWLFGVAYAQAGTILMIHIWASIFVSLALSSGKWIVAENRNNLLMERHLLAAFLNVLLNIPLIENYGGNGAAIATFISWMISSYLFDLLRSSTRSQFLMKTKSLNILGSIRRLQAHD
jgi:O-antigen/teichoic acid export membrane protein